MSYYEERIERAVNSFKKRGHMARLIENTDAITVIDWRRADGSGEYGVRYIVDKQKGNLIITGDLGDCIGSWYNSFSMHDIYTYLHDVYYFMSKFECSSDKYTYKYDDIAADISEIKKEVLETVKQEFDNEEDLSYGLDDDGYNCSDYEWDDVEEKINDDFDKIQGEMEERSGKGTYSNGVEELMDKYSGGCWWESSFKDVGERIDQRVFLWQVGFRMACEQLGFDKKEG